MKDVKTVSKAKNATELNSKFCKYILGDYYTHAVVYDIENDRSIGGLKNGKTLMGKENKLDFQYYRDRVLRAKSMFDNNFNDIELVALIGMYGSVNEFVGYKWMSIDDGCFQPNRKNRLDIYLCNFITKDKATGNLGLFAPNSWLSGRFNLYLRFYPFYLYLSPAVNMIVKNKSSFAKIVFNGRGR